MCSSQTLSGDRQKKKKKKGTNKKNIHEANSILGSHFLQGKNTKAVQLCMKKKKSLIKSHVEK